MKCRQCGTLLEKNANFCVKCGLQVGNSQNICKKCGAVLLPDALYCNKCGKKIEKIDILYCPSCGKQIVNSSLFCEYCGSRVSDKITNTIKEKQADKLNGNYHYKLTEELVVLPDTTDGTAGVNQSYFLFGDWPQSEKSDDVVVDMKPIIINNMTCFLGSDNNYYSPQDAKKNLSDAIWLKLEPIKWRAVTTDKNKMFLISEKILFFKEFNTLTNYSYNYEYIDDFFKKQTSSLNNYKCSTLRKYLNSYEILPKAPKDVKLSKEGFLNTAFTPKAQKLIKFTNIKDTNKDSTPYKDKVFLLSHEDFILKHDLDNRKERVRKAYNNARCKWWLRDSWKDVDRCDCVGEDGQLIYCESVSNAYGVVPVIQF